MRAPEHTAAASGGRAPLKFGIAVPMTLSQIFALIMPLKSAVGFRACCVAGALLFCAAQAAEQKPSLVGATRQQVLQQLGEPKSQIVAGPREILFFNGQRVVLRNGVVVDVELIPVDTPAPAPAAETRRTGTNAVPSEEPAATESSTAKPSAPGARRAATEPEANSSSSSRPDDATKTTAATPAGPALPTEPQVEIKSIRPPSRSAPVPVAAPSPAPSAPASVAPAKPNMPGAVTTTTPSAVAATTPAAEMVPTAKLPATVAPEPAPSTDARPAAPAPNPEPAVTAPATNSEPAPTESSIAPVGADATATAGAVGQPEPVASSPASDAAPAASGTAATESAPETKPAPPVAAKAKRRAIAESVDTDPNLAEVTESVFTARTYVISLVLIGVGVGYLVWRRRQRQLELAATAVSHSPFATETMATSSGARFTADLLGKLEWKRFEELVAAYYNKTGVVASRTKMGPDSPVHIRISWKGESRPFACVQCIAHPAGLVEAQPVQALCDAIAAEDIRRGYVVTPGKFNVAARDLAEEKHVTLLPGDLLLEKLNALPEPARNELMKDVTAGDYATPTCPRCDVKMARSPADSSMWQCVQCGSVLPRA